MVTRNWMTAVVLSTLVPMSAEAQLGIASSDTYKALECPLPPSMGTWAILDRDGANRKVEPYLSSLGGGESGAGIIVSPVFSMKCDRIDFTICGHDGQQGGRNQNFISNSRYGT